MSDDPRRMKVYEAEDETFDEDEESLATLQGMCNDITSSPWFKERWPHLWALTIKDGRGNRWARISPGKIHLPHGSRMVCILSHELAHHADPTGGEDHGPMFVSLWLFIVGRMYGDYRKQKLARACRKHEVAWDKKIAANGRVGG